MTEYFRKINGGGGHLHNCETYDGVSEVTLHRISEGPFVVRCKRCFRTAKVRAIGGAYMKAHGIMRGEQNSFNTSHLEIIRYWLLRPPEKCIAMYETLRVLQKNIS